MNVFARVFVLLAAAVLAGAGLITTGGPRYYSAGAAGGGGGGEAFGSYSAMDLSADAIYRIDMSAQDYPTFLTAGATHTYEAAGCWDGGPAAKLTPPNTGGADGYSALGGWQIDNGHTFTIRTLNIRWEFSHGETFVTNWAELADMKWVIVHTREFLGDTDSNQRPMANWYKQSSTNAFAIGVGAGTIKQFNPNPPPDDNGPNLDRVDFFIGPTAGTLNGKPVIGPDTWLSFEMQIVAESTATYPDGLIRMVVVDRTGTTLTDITIPWDYDAAWAGSLPRVIEEVQVIGGFFNEVYASTDANTYQRICGPTFAAAHDGLLNPRSGFVQ